MSSGDARLDDVALGEFLVFSNTLEDRTLFSNVRQLPNGRHGVQRRRVALEACLFHAEHVGEPTDLEPGAFYEDLKATVSRIVPQYFRARTNAAVSLTGGLDTRIVMGARPVMDEPTPCYTYGGYYRDCYDVHAAAEVAGACGQPHQVIPLGRDFFDDFATSCGANRLSDRRVSGYHRLPRAVLQPEARGRFRPIRITGNYGSEVLRSVSTFKGACRRAMSSRPRSSSTQGTHEPPSPGCGPKRSDVCGDAGHSLASLRSARRRPVPVGLRSPYMDNRLVSVAYSAPPALRKTSELSLRLIGDLSPALHKIGTDMGLVGSGSQLLSYPRRLHRYATFKAEWYDNLGMPDWLGPCDRPVLKKLAPLFSWLAQN